MVVTDVTFFAAIAVAVVAAACTGIIVAACLPAVVECVRDGQSVVQSQAHAAPYQASVAWIRHSQDKL